MKISKIKVERFRSIKSLTINIGQEENLIAIFGKNNVGKTNFLRAINIFFNPDQYNEQIDKMTLKKATAGGTPHPKITITFYDEKNGKKYEIIRDISKSEKKDGLSGKIFDSKDKKSTQHLTTEEINKILEVFEFIYVESVNTILPELIDDIGNDVIDARYDNARFANYKRDLKDAYDSYIDGLNKVLDSFAKDISATFQEFQPEWSVRFDVPKNSNSVRELISNDVTLQLDDSGSIGIEDKGAGLQRLAAILLQFEVLTRKKKKSKTLFVLMSLMFIFMKDYRKS